MVTDITKETNRNKIFDWLFNKISTAVGDKAYVYAAHRIDEKMLDQDGIPFCFTFYQIEVGFNDPIGCSVSIHVCRAHDIEHEDIVVHPDNDVSPSYAMFVFEDGGTGPEDPSITNTDPFLVNNVYEWVADIYHNRDDSGYDLRDSIEYNRQADKEFVDIIEKLNNILR